MSKISNLAKSIKTTSQQEAKSIEQELANDFAKTRQSISDCLSEEANTIKSDIRTQLKQSVAHAIAESTSATEATAIQIAQQIEKLQQRISEQLTEQEAQIVQDMITELKKVHLSIIDQLWQMKNTVSNTDTQLQTMLKDYNNSLAKTQAEIGKAWDSVEAQRWNVEEMTKHLQQAQDKHARTYDKIMSQAIATDKEAGDIFFRAAQNIRRTGRELEQEAQDTVQRTTAQLASINKTIDNISESMTAKLYQRTYYPLAMIAWAVLLLMATMIGSCSMYNNYKTSSALAQQINQQQAIIADLAKPISAATATQLSNLVTIEQTQHGILIKSRHPATTDTIRKDGSIPAQNQRALLIKR